MRLPLWLRYEIARWRFARVFGPALKKARRQHKAVRPIVLKALRGC